ncbi:MAG: DUF3040 domain-containing protein [Candidatus Nanopelagicales bacterium]
MPLSEHEQRLLEQMERALYAEDPKFATTLRSGGPRTAHRGRAALGVVALLAGIGLLMAGVITSLPPLGVVGFLVMLVGAFVSYSAFRSGGAAEGEQVAEGQEAGSATPGAGGKPTRAQAKAAKSGGFMDRLEDRWRRRRDEGMQ